MNDFDPAKLAALQVDEIEVTISREVAALLAKWVRQVVAAKLSPEPEAIFVEADELVDRLENFGRAGVDHPDAVFCIACGQLDEPELHDPSRCPGCGE